jgi:hypothetical protein
LNGLKHGYGIYRWANGDVYCGEWKENNQDGQGYKRWADGEEYCGEWKNHMQHGEGILQKNGKLYSVKHDEGKLISYSELAKDVDQK